MVATFIPSALTQMDGLLGESQLPVSAVKMTDLGLAIPGGLALVNDSGRLVQDSTLKWNSSDSTLAPIGFKEPTGSGSISATFGRNNLGAYDSLVELRTQQTLTLDGDTPSGTEIGQGCIRIIDRINNRKAELGWYEFGFGLFTSGMSAHGDQPFEMWTDTGNVSIRANNLISRLHHRLNLRQPVDGDGSNVSQGYLRGDITKANGSWFYSDEVGKPIGVLAQDGTSLVMTGGVAEFNGRYKAGPNPVDVRLISGASGQTSDLTWGYWTGSFTTQRFKARYRTDDTWVLAPWSSGAEVTSTAMYLDQSGRLGLGTTPLGSSKLAVNGGCWLGTGAGTNGRGLVIDGSTGTGTISLTGSGSGGNKMGFYLTGFTSDWIEVGRNSANPLFRVYGDGSVVLNQAPLATTAVAGFTYIPSFAGKPTGTPSAYSGMAGIPMGVDTSNKQLCFYISGAWYGAALTPLA